MVIQYYGDSCVRLQSGDVSLLINPTSNRLKADAVLRTEGVPHASETGEIALPGEYELKGIEITGVALPKESNEKQIVTAYAIRFEEITFAVFGVLHDMPDVEALEHFEEPDILILSGNGEKGLSAEEMLSLVKKLEPGIVIPLGGAEREKFLKLMGQKVTPEEKLVLKKKDIVSEKARAVLLTPAS